MDEQAISPEMYDHLRNLVAAWRNYHESKFFTHPLTFPYTANNKDAYNEWKAEGWDIVTYLDLILEQGRKDKR